MRLIDADALLEAIGKNPIIAYHKNIVDQCEAYIKKYQSMTGFGYEVDQANKRLRLHKQYMDGIKNLITNAPTVQQSEPFGYFKAEPFGWTDCAETDEGAIALYEAPTVQREAINEVYEFEKWLKENTLIRANLNIELDYADPLAEIAYKAWQARSKLNLQTVQREGWVSVEDLQRLYDDMFRHKDIAITANSLFKLINHE